MGRSFVPAGRNISGDRHPRISLGGGFRYLMESVAAGDTGVRPAEGLAAYYPQSGNPPGRFLGAGLADLDGGRGVKPGTTVTEDHLRRMLGMLCDPLSGDPVGGVPLLSAKRAPVAGFDLTFSPPKSVSVAWALADPATKAVIYDCHRRAVDFVLAYGERHVFRSRSGSGGLAEAILADAARVAQDAVADRRATFSRHNLTAEALRLLHGVRFAGPAERVAIAERITALALDESVLLNPTSVGSTPDFSLRPDGTSRLQSESRRLYTTHTILDAEERLLDAGRRTDGPSVSRRLVAQVTDQAMVGTEDRLSVNQAVAVEAIGTSGRELDVLVGPAGTGKSTTTGLLRAVWEAQYGAASSVWLPRRRRPRPWPTSWASTPTTPRNG